MLLANETQLFVSFQWKIFGTNGTSEKEVLFFRWKLFRWKFVFIYKLHQFQAIRGHIFNFGAKNGAWEGSLATNETCFKWNTFLSRWKFPEFFGKWKTPVVFHGFPTGFFGNFLYSRKQRRFFTVLGWKKSFHLTRKVPGISNRRFLAKWKASLVFIQVFLIKFYTGRLRPEIQTLTL